MTQSPLQENFRLQASGSHRILGSFCCPFGEFNAGLGDKLCGVRLSSSLVATVHRNLDSEETLSIL